MLILLATHLKTGWKKKKLSWDVFFLKMFYSPNHIIQKIVVFIAFLELKGVVGDKGWSRGS